MKLAVSLSLGLLVLAIVWFLASPLFIDRTVNEEFDYMNADGSVDVAMVMAIPETTRIAMMDDIMTAAANAPEIETVEEMPAETSSDEASAAPEVIARGQFRDADAVHKGSGDALLYALPDGRHLLRLENFRTTNGPDLVVYLAKHADPASADDVTSGGFLSLGKLKGNVGNQNYFVPGNIDVGEYESVVIWCELFGVLFSPAPLMVSATTGPDAAATE